MNQDWVLTDSVVLATFKQPKYKCPKCERTLSAWDAVLSIHTDKYCIDCLNNWVKQNVPELVELKEPGDETSKSD